MKAKAIRRTTRPNPISDKRRKDREAYRKAAIEFLAEHTFCEFFWRLKQIRIPSTEVHHIRGRSGRLYLAKEFWAAVSKKGHERIHREPKLAQELGLLGPWGKQT